MGGHAAGEVASKIAVDTVLSYFRDQEPLAADASLIDAPLGAQLLSDAVNKANETILQYADGHSTASGMGTTLVAARFVDGRFTIAHVGDSRIYLLREGALLQLTEDHSLVMEQVRRGIMTVEEAKTLHGATHHYPRARHGRQQSAGSCRVSRRGRRHPAADHRWRSAPPRRSDRSTTSSPTLRSLQAACDALIEAALDAGGEDNATCVLIRVKREDGDDPLDQQQLIRSRNPLLHSTVLVCGLAAPEAIMEIKSVGVIGAGTMGNGIAHVFAKCGYEVVLVDVEQRFLDRGLETIRKNLEREVAKEKITAEARDAAIARITPTMDRTRLAACDFIVEAASERFEIKSELFRDLDQLCRPEVILSSNTSSISITKLAAVTKRPDKVIGMHFFNPVPMMKLVEVIRGLATSDETYATVKALAEKLEKTPVEVNDAPGFVSNRVLMPLLNEAMYTVMEGVATPQAVDEVFKLGMAHPMGPLTLADFIGLDVCLDIMRVMHNGLGDPKYRPCPLLIKMVDAGWLGRKSGRGFYQY